MTPASDGTDTIVHLFDWPFRAVEAALPVLASEHFDAVQVSPPQASLDRPDWWARYQPLDHTRLEGPLGSEAEFRAMIAAAHRLEPPMKVIVDVVLNHMAEQAPGDQPLRYARFGPEHFHPRAAIDWNSIESIRTGWIGHGPDLPDLRTEHPHVRAEARRYLERLLDCGADGFRFDAVKHIEPAFFAEVLAGLPAGLLMYGEYIAQPGHGAVMAEYLPHMRLMDFSGLQALGRALAAGDVRALADPPPHPDAIDPARSVAFVTNHDIELDQYGGFHLPPEHLDLAHAVVLTQPGVPPLVWHEHRDDPVVRAALRLRRRARGRPRRVARLQPPLLAWRFGDAALLALNLGDTPVVLDPPAHLGVAGEWIDDLSGARIEGAWTVPPRAPAFARPAAAQRASQPGGEGSRRAPLP